MKRIVVALSVATLLALVVGKANAYPTITPGPAHQTGQVLDSDLQVDQNGGVHLYVKIANGDGTGTWYVFDSPPKPIAVVLAWHATVVAAQTSTNPVQVEVHYTEPEVPTDPPPPANMPEPGKKKVDAIPGDSLGLHTPEVPPAGSGTPPESEDPNAVE